MRGDRNPTPVRRNACSPRSWPCPSPPPPWRRRRSRCPSVADGNEEGGDKEVFLEFKGRKVVATLDAKELEFFEVASLDPSTTPKLIDLKSLVDMGPISKGSVYEAIYQVDGDDLSIAIYFGAGNKRPAKFESEKDSMVVVVTFKREKK
jgi:uncharacterized protein (TIGR03067 family)